MMSRIQFAAPKVVNAKPCYIKSRYKCRGYVFFLLSVLALTGCSSLIPIEDYCDPNSGCTLDSCKNAIAVELNQNDPKEIEVCACKPWNPSGILVSKGDIYTFQLNGFKEDWIDGKEGNNPVTSTPQQGWIGFCENFTGFLISSLKRSDKANWYALVANVGKGKDDKKSFVIFKDTDETQTSEIKMNDDGELFFFANDMWGRYGNNRGILNLLITLKQKHH